VTKYFAVQQEEDEKIEAVIKGRKKRAGKSLRTKEPQPAPENPSRNGQDLENKSAALRRKEAKKG
jgi:hypothetical protein